MRTAGCSVLLAAVQRVVRRLGLGEQCRAARVGACLLQGGLRDSYAKTVIALASIPGRVG